MFAIRNATKIVSIDGSTDTVSKPASKPAAPKSVKTKSQSNFQQEVLDLIESKNDFRQVQPGARTQSFCKYRVATENHRAAAAVVDFALILLSMALFASVFVYCGGEIAFDAPIEKIVFGSLGILIPFLYKLYWAVAGTDTPGAVILGLHLTDFDGRRPTRSVRIHRIVWSGVSTCSAFLGIAWILFDEESLSWHDHITQTYLTAQTYSGAEPAARNSRMVNAWAN